ncbi:MAG: helix-hairpin-helix domain-containing protein [Deltaproteobacteria bacterium]|nr:helix-hairpin-helix domain-containing protein [Deltaproteobacteria bacterium]
MIPVSDGMDASPAFMAGFFKTSQGWPYNRGALGLLVFFLLFFFYLKTSWPARPAVPLSEPDGPVFKEAGPAGRFVLTGVVDINRAGIEELSALPGIGTGLAKRIIEKRKAIGGFKSPDELKEVMGIGEAKLSALRRYVVAGRRGF